MIVSTWTEDRAMLGSNPSAVPGAATEGPGHRPGVPPDSGSLRDQHQCDKPIVQPPKRLRIVQPAPSRSRRTSTETYGLCVSSRPVAISYSRTTLSKFAGQEAGPTQKLRPLELRATTCEPLGMSYVRTVAP